MGIEVNVQGSASALPDLLLLPGWNCPSWIWRGQAEQLSKARRVLQVDWPASPPAGASAQHYSLSELASLTFESISEQTSAKLVILGHSFGGAVGLEIARRNPSRVASVIGADSLTFMDFYPKVDEAAIEEILKPLERDFPTAVSDTARGYFSSATERRVANRLTRAMCAGDPAWSISLLRALFRWDMLQALEAYPGPVFALVAAATFDRDRVTRQLGDRVALQVIPDSGHFVMLDQPERFTEALTSVLRSEPNSPL